jgi:hypothetical protein
MAKAHQGMTGQIRYAKWLSYRMSRVELLCFVGLFGFVFLLTESAPFLGGALLTTLTAMKHSKLCKESESQPDIGKKESSMKLDIEEQDKLNAYDAGKLKPSSHLNKER